MIGLSKKGGLPEIFVSAVSIFGIIILLLIAIFLLHMGNKTKDDFSSVSSMNVNTREVTLSYLNTNLDFCKNMEDNVQFKEIKDLNFNELGHLITDLITKTKILSYDGDFSEVVFKDKLLGNKIKSYESILTNCTNQFYERLYYGSDADSKISFYKNDNYGEGEYYVKTTIKDLYGARDDLNYEVFFEIKDE